MTKFGQAEYIDFIAKIFADKLDKILETDEKQNFNSKIQRIFTGNFRPQRTQHNGGINVFGFFIGLVVGGVVGMFAMCLCKAASDADRCMNQTDFKD